MCNKVHLEDHEDKDKKNQSDPDSGLLSAIDDLCESISSIKLPDIDFPDIDFPNIDL